MTRYSGLPKAILAGVALVFSAGVAAAQIEPPLPPPDMYGAGTMRGRLAERALRDFDLNHDGKITKDEMRKALAQRFAEAGGGAQGMSEAQFVKNHQRFLSESATREFRKLDWNGDGVLSLDEFREGLRARFEKLDRDGTGAIPCKPAGNPANGKSHRSVGGAKAKLCQEADLNHDGKITRDEFDKAAIARFNAVVKGGKGMTLAQYVQDQMGPFLEAEARRFKRLNKNGDGKLTLAEFSAPAEKLFDKLDKNHDGVLTPDELSHAKRGGGRIALRGAPPGKAPPKRGGH